MKIGNYTKEEWDLMHRGICPDDKKYSIRREGDFYMCEKKNCGWFIRVLYADQTLKDLGYKPVAP